MEEGLSEEEVISLLQKYKEMDVPFSEKVMNSMCTAPHPLAVKAHMMFIEANLGNPGLYPGTAEMEREVIYMAGRLLSHPDPAGYMVSGGTEANITALWMARNLWGKGEVIFPESAHFSIMKALDLLGLDPVPVPLVDYRMSVDAVEDAINDRTVAVVALAGSTELGLVDPIDEIADAAGGTFLHVDASFGGFVLPFLRRLGINVRNFDFSVEGVTTICTDPHKMGLSTIPSGIFLMREEMKAMEFDAPYLTRKKQSTLSGTRNSASVAATWAVMKHLGMEGFTRVVKRCMENTQLMVEGLRKLGAVPVVEPETNIVAFNTDDDNWVLKEMEARGWHLSLSSRPRAIRAVIMPHVTRESVLEFLKDMEEVMERIP